MLSNETCLNELKNKTKRFKKYKILKVCEMPINEKNFRMFFVEIDRKEVNHPTTIRTVIVHEGPRGGVSSDVYWGNYLSCKKSMEECKEVNL